MWKLQIIQNADNPTVYDLTEEKVTVGRLPDNTISIDDASISSHHAELQLETEGYRLRDLGSTNGTFVNGEQITEAVLRHGDQVRFGKVDGVLTNEEQATGDVQTPPTMEAAPVQTGALSARPENFTTISPHKKPEGKKDVLLVVAIVLAALGALATLGALFQVLTLQAPA